MSDRKRVLLIDDDQAVVAYLTTKLSPLYEVVSTTNPRDAALLARTELPDVILCDIDMPGMSGGEVAALLAEDSATSRVPLIYLTSMVTPQETRDLGGMVGGKPGVSKRAPMAELVARIDEVTR